MTNPATWQLPSYQRAALGYDETLRLVEVFYWTLPVKALFGRFVAGEAGKGIVRAWSPLPEQAIDAYSPRPDSGPSDSTMLVLPLNPWIYAEWL